MYYLKKTGDTVGIFIVFFLTSMRVDPYLWFAFLQFCKKLDIYNENRDAWNFVYCQMYETASR